jgi:hypothetical protein
MFPFKVDNLPEPLAKVNLGFNGHIVILKSSLSPYLEGKIHMRSGPQNLAVEGLSL